MQVLLTAPVPGDDLDTLRTAPWLARRHAMTVLPSVSSLAILRRTAAPPPPSAAAPHARTGPETARQPYLALANPLLLGPDGDDRSAFAVTACPDTRRAAAPLVASNVTGLETFFRGATADAARLRALAPLPDTAAEVCAVARDLDVSPGSVLLGPAATETRLRALDAAPGRLTRYRVLHFATHGLVSGEVRGIGEPALVLTPPATPSAADDGVLTASEVAEFELDADWVILSACNTAAGSGEDAGGGEALSGLARSFFFAGARALLVSHWPVRSDAAVALTTRALHLVAREPGIARSEALRRAMVAVIEDDAMDAAAHPQVWAPFVVVGEGGSGPPR
jgi:CHAT domain-containing protein